MFDISLVHAVIGEGVALAAGFVAGVLVGRKNAGTVEQAVTVATAVSADVKAAADAVQGKPQA